MTRSSAKDGGGRLLETTEALWDLVMTTMEGNGEALPALIRNPTLPEVGLSDLAIRNLLASLALVDFNNNPSTTWGV